MSSGPSSLDPGSRTRAPGSRPRPGDPDPGTWTRDWGPGALWQRPSSWQVRMTVPLRNLSCRDDLGTYHEARQCFVSETRHRCCSRIIHCSKKKMLVLFKSKALPLVKNKTLFSSGNRSLFLFESGTLFLFKSKSHAIVYKRRHGSCSEPRHFFSTTIYWSCWQTRHCVCSKKQGIVVVQNNSYHHWVKDSFCCERN